MLINVNGITRDMTKEEEERHNTPKKKPIIDIQQKAEAFDYLTSRNNDE